MAAINWHDKTILLGEYKWGVKAVERTVIRELIDKTSKVIPGEEWQVYYAYFARAGFTEAAREEAQNVNALLVSLETLDRDLRRL